MPEAVSTETSKQEAKSFDRKPHPRDRQHDPPGVQGSILGLQHAAGNQVVSELLRSQLENSQLSGGIVQRHWLPCGSPEDPSFECDEDEKKGDREDRALAGIQTKLTVSHPRDAYEREADNVADLVMRMPNQPLGSILTAPAAVQRECATCASGEELCPKCDEEEQVNRSPESAGLTLLQRQLDISRKGREGVSTPAFEVPGKVAASITGIRGRGLSMPQSTRSFFEQRFGFDFSSVRVHLDQRAGETARSLHAKAFTIGHDVVFGTGQYAPETPEGRRLIAHELTHVVQQNRLSRLNARSNEMIPGYADQNLHRKIQAAPISMIQCDKIDHRQLTWDDFQAPVPKKAKFDAATASDFRDPALKNLAPATVVTEDTGEECKVGKKMLTKFKAAVGIDPEQIEVKAFMWQDKSWKKEWTTEKEAREEKCKTGLVKKCEAAFDKQFKKIAAKRAARVKECKAHFGASLKQATKECKPVEKQCIKHFTSKQEPPFEIDVDGRTIAANTKKECSSVVLKECTNELMKSVTFSSEVEGEEAEATTKAECSTDFAQSIEDLLKAQAKWTGAMAGEEAEVTSKEECRKSFLDACATRLSDAASSALLAHEQGHFDITNVFANKTQDALRALAETFIKDVTACGEDAAVKKAKQEAKTQIQKLQKRYKAGKSEMSKKQTLYDKQTNHGKVEEKQSEWEQKIAEGFSE